jgi:hypothetical protein
MTFGLHREQKGDEGWRRAWLRRKALIEEAGVTVRK